MDVNGSTTLTATKTTLKRLNDGIYFVGDSYSDDKVTIDVGHVGKSVNADALAEALSARFSGSDFSPL